MLHFLSSKMIFCLPQGLLSSRLQKWRSHDADELTTLLFPGLKMPLTVKDSIVLYTDGTTEVFNSNGQMLGIEGVQETVRRNASLPVEEMKQAILNGVAALAGGPADR